MRNRTSTLVRILGNAAISLIGLALLLTAQVASAQTTVYAVGSSGGDGSGYCGTVNLTNGQWTQLSSGLLSLAGIAEIGPNLYGGGASSNTLYQVNPANCSYTPIGNGSLSSYHSFGSTKGGTTALYAIAADSTYDLYYISPGGGTSLIGPTNLNATSLSADCPALYAIGSGSNLFYVDTTTGTVTFIATIHLFDISAMVCANGQLYAVGEISGNKLLCTVNPTDGGILGCGAYTGPALFGMADPPPAFSVLHTFTGGLDGSLPFAGMTMDPAGNFYGTAAAGGTGSCSYLGTTGCGTIFELKKYNNSYLFNPLYSFRGGMDGEFPVLPLTRGPNGTFYGATLGGGEGTCIFDGASGCGIVFNAGPNPTPPRTPLLTFRESPLYRFTGGSDGGNPYSTVIFDQAGNMYGTTVNGGTNGYGAVFELSPAGGGTYTETVLYSFAGPNNGEDGADPQGGLIFDTAGNLYGTTEHGGIASLGGRCSDLGCGTVFELSPTGGGNWTEKVVYRFQNTDDGAGPISGVAIDSAGNLYGSTQRQGSGNVVTIYELIPNGGNWTFTVLYGSEAGFAPGYGRVVLDSSGNLYDTALVGPFASGQVFELTHGSWIYTDLYDFTGGSDGASPYGGVALDSSGNLYGTAALGGIGPCSLDGYTGCGVVWKLTPPTN